jgi:hypothetical protein
VEEGDFVEGVICSKVEEEFFSMGQVANKSFVIIQMK